MGARVAVEMQELGWFGFDGPGVVDALGRAAERVAPLLAEADARPSATVPGLRWTVGEVATHLAAIASLYEGYLGGNDTFGYDLLDVAGSNERLSAAAGGPSPTGAAEELRRSIEGAVLAGASRGPLDPVPWHGSRLPSAALLGLLLGELLVHGRDLAMAMGHAWELGPDAVHVARAGVAAADQVVDRTLATARPATYRLRLEGLPDLLWEFSAGGLSTRPAVGDPARVDCSLRTDPETMVLVAFGRTHPIRAALHGKAWASGRRPWLALRMTSYLSLG